MDNLIIKKCKKILAFFSGFCKYYFKKKKIPLVK